MTRLERRKRSRARKDAKAAKLNARALKVREIRLNQLFFGRPERQALLKEGKLSEREKSLLTSVIERGKAERSGCLGNAAIYRGTCYPAPGYGTGAFKERPLSERQCRELRSQER